ncbi:MAG: hypothetical protein WKF34_04160 [Pyrinomonadaceae bacterium]
MKLCVSLLFTLLLVIQGLDVSAQTAAIDSSKSAKPAVDAEIELPVAATVLASTETDKKNLSYVILKRPTAAAPEPTPPDFSPNVKSSQPNPRKPANADSGFDWSSAFRQSLAFLAVQHGYALTQPKTREALKGPFFRDYFKSVKALHGWADGGRFFTNYIAHPLEGSFLGFIQVQNDGKGRGEPLSASPRYWKSRAKALAWSAAWSTQFEIGPISQASIGNVGLKGKQTYVDIVITPTVGLALLVTEDALDKYVIRSLERRTKNYFIKIFARMLLNPTRSMANLINLKTPWHRDKGLRL